MTLGDEQFLGDLYNLKYLFGDKWAPAIIVALAGGKMRRVELRSTVKSYSIGAEWSRSGKPAVLHDTMLSRTLKNMTEKGLLVRTRRTDTSRKGSITLWRRRSWSICRRSSRPWIGLDGIRISSRRRRHIIASTATTWTR